MKELAKYFSRSYSVVSQKEDGYAAEKNNWQQQQQQQQQKEQQQQHKSPLSTPKRIIHQMFPVNKVCSKRISTPAMKKGKKSPKCSFLLMAGGIFAIIAAIMVKIMQPYEIIFQYKLKLEEGGEIFNLWEKPPVDLYVKIYLFNITNAEEYLTGKEKMKVEQVGPYVYKEIMEHDDVIFNENDTMSTRPRHPLVWQEEMSEGRSEDDELMMVNIALLSIAQVAADRSYFFRIPINILIRQTNSQPIVKMTAREFMFGYETSLTTLGNTLLPNWISFDKVGLVDRMYDFDEDFETFYTGADDVSRSGLYDTYKGSKNLAQWDGEHCSSIHLASDGTKFPSYMEPNDTALFFRKSMCRPQKLVPDGEPTVISGLAAQKFIFEENALDNGYYNQKNKCFCRNGYCQPRGLIDVTDCYYGFPISLSYPHFMDTDPVLLENIEGLKPNYSEHGSYFMVQPRSGLPLECSVKLQINMHMRDVRSMANVERFSHTTIPMLWFEITMPKLPEPLKNRFTLYLNILPYIDIIGFWGGLIVAGVCLLLAFTTASSNLTLLPTSDSKTKYAKANIRSGIYKPCEVKLIEMNEKTAQRKKEEEAMMYEIDLRNAKSYILEHEPAISVSDDEGNESDNSSRQSSPYTPSGNNSNNLQTPVSNIRRSSSGYESRNLNGSGNWMMGEASSLIDDIGNDHFPSLKLSSNDLEQYTNEASEV